MQTNEQLLSAIENYLAQTEFPAEPELLYAPIGYSLAGGGKRLRPMLLMLSNGIFTDKIQHALPAAAAVEVFHNFTLLHDDIMDNAAVRRGKPSVYAKWGQNVAILSGDAVNGVQLVVVLLLAAYVLVKIVFTEAGRVPVDDPRTHLELTMIHEVMCLDYCGVDLAYIKMAGWLKTAALSVLAADAVAATCCPRWWAAAPLAVLVTGLSVGIVESTQARNKLARNTTFILTVAALAVRVFFTGYLLQLNIGLQ